MPTKVLSRDRITLRDADMLYAAALGATKNGGPWLVNRGTKVSGSKANILDQRTFVIFDAIL